MFKFFKRVVAFFGHMFSRPTGGGVAPATIHVIPGLCEVTPHGKHACTMCLFAASLSGAVTMVWKVAKCYISDTVESVQWLGVPRAWLRGETGADMLLRWLRSSFQPYVAIGPVTIMLA